MENRDDKYINRKKRKHAMLEKRARKMTATSSNIQDEYPTNDTHMTTIATFINNPTYKKPPPNKKTIPSSSNETFLHQEITLPNPNIENIESITIHDLGLPSYECRFCGAIFWLAECVKKYKIHSQNYHLCCSHGKVKIPPLKPSPPLLEKLMDYNNDRRSKLFRDNIRTYNSMFAFTSIGAKIDKDINKTPGPYIFKISGQNYHRIGSLLPPDNDTPKFAQLYIYDTENEAKNRRQANGYLDEIHNDIDTSIIQSLINMFDETNEIVKAFRMARDRLKETNYMPMKLRLISKRQHDSIQYNLPTNSEIAGLIVGDFGEANQHRDIIVDHKSQGFQRISELHPSFMAMQYPILFPYGEDGYTLDLPYHNISSTQLTKRQSITMREYYAYRIQQRPHEGLTLIKGGKLLQQYIVDAFTCVEEERLNYIKHNQNNLRSEIYKGIQDAFDKGDLDGNAIGKRVILPSSFTGSRRYMMQNYHDAMAICKFYGNPDLFITFTCNVQWIEIENALNLIPGQKIEDRPDIMSRIFKLKVDELLNDLTKKIFFGRTLGAIYTIEFQKRGLPHVHILLWLDDEDKHPTPSHIDRIISAEIPDKKTYPKLYQTVAKFMIHGPCGFANNNAPCMLNKHCSKKFPKPFNPETTIDSNGFASYRRRENNATVTKKNIQLDNRFVVPFNKQLLLKYQAHINVEWCNKSSSIKYLFKYINKGPDRTRAIIENNESITTKNEIINPNIIDEIKLHLDCRYLTAYEAIWRLFQFHITFKQPPVERLTIHLPYMNNIIYHANDNLENVLNRTDVKSTMFTEWMNTNLTHTDARTLTYAAFPTKWVWNKKKSWTRRKKGFAIGRISYVHPTAGELYYLRMLLNIVKGPTNYQDIRTVDGIIHPTFQTACKALGLLGDDKEWHEAMAEATHWASSAELRQLFVTLILFCEVNDPTKLLQSYNKNFTDDIIHKLRKTLDLPLLEITQEEIENYILHELQILFNRHGTSLHEHHLPTPQEQSVNNIGNRLIQEELNYDIKILTHEHEILKSQLNIEQYNIYEAVICAIETKKGGSFFVYGHGGTGKTFLYQTIITKLRSEGKIVLAVASSGIASLLLPGGRTAHSRFKIPLQLHKHSTCDIKKGTQLAELLRKTSLIVWDEAPMAHKHCFEALNKTLIDITTDDIHQPTTLFGGKVVLLGGDFRQILPVIPNGTRFDTINACITNSYLWKEFTLFTLTKNMRLSHKQNNNITKETIENFASWILDIGDGLIKTNQINNDDSESNNIEIPQELIPEHKGNAIENITNTIYEDFNSSYTNYTYLTERAIITVTNETVNLINSYMLGLIPSEEKIYLSYDSICKTTQYTEDQDLLYPIDFLNSLKFNGIPDHELRLKTHVPIMLLRNIDQTNGLCNGTRLMITQLGCKIIEATIITGSHIGKKVYIPRIIMSTSDNNLPFTLKRRQFPIKICYTMTINKSQGQTLKKVGLYLPTPVFTHGQLYVALSRVNSPCGLKIIIEDEEKNQTNYTKNIVYNEILSNIHPH